MEDAVVKYVVIKQGVRAAMQLEWYVVRELAEQVAIALAKKHPGEMFYVFKAVTGCGLPREEPVFTRLDEVEDDFDE